MPTFRFNINGKSVAVDAPDESAAWRALITSPDFSGKGERMTFEQAWDAAPSGSAGPGLFDQSATLPLREQREQTLPGYLMQ
jgi:hypothetical protein